MLYRAVVIVIIAVVVAVGVAVVVAAAAVVVAAVAILWLLIGEATVETLYVGENAFPIGILHSHHVFNVQQRTDSSQLSVTINRWRCTCT